jgi:hypothetical protein
MNSNTYHENDMLSFSAYLHKRKIELKGVPEKSIEEKATYEWQAMPVSDKMRYYSKIEEEGIPERRPNTDEL